LLVNREVALRLATNKDIDRKLKIAVGSRFFWVYLLSLWDPDAFWKCVLGASAFTVVGLFLMTLIPSGSTSMQLTASVAFEYFLLGLILMWACNLGAWLRPTNLVVIVTLIFGLYRKNKTMDDLSAQEIGRLFPENDSVPVTGRKVIFSRAYQRMRRSRVLGPLVLGSVLAALVVTLLLLAS
jgi:hypothetical protein